MELIKFKKLVNDNLVDDNLIIFKTSNDFISEQYYKKIAENKKLDIIFINKIEDIADYDDNNNKLFIYKLDILNNMLIKIENLKNLIIICKDIKADKYDNYIIEIPELEDWEVEEYIKQTCPNLKPNTQKLLFNYLKDNIYTLNNEINKINLFYLTTQDYYATQIFNNISETLKLNNLIELLSNNIISRNLDYIKFYLNFAYNQEINISDLIKVLLNKYKKVIDKKDYSKEQEIILAKKYKFLLDFEYIDNKIIKDLSYVETLNYLITKIV